MLKKYNLILLDYIFNELENVLGSKKFKLGEKRISDIVETLRKKSKVITPITEFDVVKADPSDNGIISTAYDGNADYIVTGQMQYD